MAVTVVPNRQSFGGSIGSSIGSGLGQGLSMLAQRKFNEIENQKKSQVWQSIGLDPQTANFIAQQPESVQRDFVSRLEGFGQQQGYAPQQNSYAQPQGMLQDNSYQMDQSGQSVQSPSMQPQSSGVTIGKSKIQKDEEAKKFKESKEFRKAILQGKRESRETIKDLNRLEELSNSGKLDTPGYVEFLSRAGLDVPALMNEESQEFAKIQQNFLKNAKQYFGGRVSNYEVEQFLKTVPSLSQTPAGRSRVIANLKYMARGADEYYKAYEEVLRENRGVPPYDVEEQVERKAEKRLDRIYDQFKKDVNKPAPKGQNRAITALQAAGGSILGNIGKTAGNIANVAGIGKLL